MRATFATALLLIASLSLAACGQSPGCRAVTGGAIGAGGGAILGAIGGNAALGALDAQPFMRDRGAVAVADPLHRGRDLHLPLGPRFQVAKHAAGGFDLLCVASVHRTGPWAIDITKRQKTRGRTRRSHSKRVHCNQKGTSVEQAVAAIGL